MPKISARTVAEHRAETIDRLVDAFGDLVLERGYDAVSLADVAAHVELARTAIYNYFPDRESLLLAWTEREVRRTLDAMLAEVDSAETCTEKVRVFVRMQFEAFSSRHLPPGLEVGQLLSPEAYKRFMDHVEPLEHALRGILAEGVASGEFIDVDPATTVPLVLGAIGAERVPIANGLHDVAETTDRVTEFLLRALVNPSPRRRKS